jgi:hypothetical protein
MKCDKCGFEYPEKLIHESHDIPKYMGGEDKDGRHNLCKLCHDDYEEQVLKIAMMNFIKFSTDDVRKKCRFGAKIVRTYFFKKKDDKNGDTKTTA